MDYSNLPIVERLIKSYPRRSNPDQANIEKMQISLMAALDEKEFRTLETALVKIFDSGTQHQCEMAEEIMTDMLAYSSHSIDQLIVSAIDRQGYLPAPLFRGAGIATAKIVRKSAVIPPGFKILNIHFANRVAVRCCSLCR